MKVITLLEQPSSWEEARSLLRSSPLSSTDFTKILDRYSDSNWENHMLGDLYRNQGLASLKVITIVYTYQVVQSTRNNSRSLLRSIVSLLLLL